MIDIKKAFDSLDQNYMIETLEYFGVSKEVQEVVRFIAESFFYYIQEINGEVTPKKGIPQGSCIAPTLFSMSMIRIMEQSALKILQRRADLKKVDYPGNEISSPSSFTWTTL